MKLFIYITITLYIFSCSPQKKFTGQCVTKNNEPIKATIIFLPSQKSIETDSLGYFSSGALDKNDKIFYAKEYSNISRIFKIEELAHKKFIIKIPDVSYYKSFHTTKRCPICNDGSFVVPILYGYPDNSAFEEEKKGKIKIGGCEKGETELYCKKHQIEF